MSSKFLDISTDCVVFGFEESNNRLQILLIEQEKIDEDTPPKFALPGDLVFVDEDVDTSANRVLKELTGINGFYLKQFATFGDVNRTSDSKDQKWLLKYRENPHRRIVTIGYYSIVRKEGYEPVPSSFARKAFWTNIEDVPDLAFDHNKILELGLASLRHDTLYSNISINLLPKKFTLAQLQNLYEIILGKELDKRNFRKSIKKIDELIPLDEKQIGVYHKPAQLFSFERIE